MSMVGFPLLLIPLAVYNIVVFLMPGVSLADPLFQVRLMSGAEWPISLADMLLALGVLLLLLEVIKGARPGAKYVTDHLLSLIVFSAAAAEFLLWPKFATSTYCLLTLLALVDFLSGVALRVQRRSLVAPAAAVSRRAASQATPEAIEPRKEPESAKPAPEPRPEPATASPASSGPSAASSADSVPMDHPDPKTAQAVPNEASPTIVSPDLQPAGSSQAPPEKPQR